MAETAFQLCFTLGQEIIKDIRQEFADKHLSMNLVNTMQFHVDPTGVVIKIPAQVYDQGIFIKQGAVVYTSNASYADALDKEGSYVLGRHIGNHVGWVNKCVEKGVMRWIKDKDLGVVISG